jgi:benzodiazapine receptor
LNSKRNFKTLPIFIGISFLAMGFGSLFRPGDWYASLNLAPWTPPNIAFPIVWGFLYLIIALAGWTIFSHDDSRLKQLWVAQLLINAAWSWLFFAQHWVAIALIDILVLDLLVSLLVAWCFKAALKSAAWMLMPYLCWILLASTLNIYVLLMNS